MDGNPFRDLPSVSDVLASSAGGSLVQEHGHEPTVLAIRAAIEELRERLGSGSPSNGQLSPQIVAQLAAGKFSNPRLQTVINATGIVLHTNLGRAPIATVAANAAQSAAASYLNLELDLATGKRSSRQDLIRDWICRLTGAESATAVNNCAAATILVLRALAAGKEVVVSRGQLVEIGGGFRIPEIMGVSGAVLREVGTTNITRIGDYERAITENTALLLRVHQSNYRIHGHTDAPSLDELVALGQKRKIPVVDDIGSGALIDCKQFGLSGEPVVSESLAIGADLVLFSGDKLLGGPQAGIIAGRNEQIAKIERDPLMRAMRLDKMTLAALEATLRLYLDRTRALENIPILQMLGARLDELRHRARALADQLSGIPGVIATVRDDETFVGGGSLPDRRLPTAVVVVTVEDMSEDEFAGRLRTGTPAVIGRIQNGTLLLDPRTIFAEQEPALVEAIRRSVHTG